MRMQAWPQLSKVSVLVGWVCETRAHPLKPAGSDPKKMRHLPRWPGC